MLILSVKYHKLEIFLIKFTQSLLFCKKSCLLISAGDNNKRIKSVLLIFQNILEKSANTKRFFARLKQQAKVSSTFLKTLSVKKMSLVIFLFYFNCFFYTHLLLCFIIFVLLLFKNYIYI